MDDNWMSEQCKEVPEKTISEKKEMRSFTEFSECLDFIRSNKGHKLSRGLNGGWVAIEI
jgi:hypothetical protein